MSKKKKKRSILKSKEWKELREKALDRDRHKCFLCGSDEGLTVHHILYRKGYSQFTFELDNLITLCKGCHFGIHRGVKNISLIEKLRKYRKDQHEFILENI